MYVCMSIGIKFVVWDVKDVLFYVHTMSYQDIVQGQLSVNLLRVLESFSYCGGYLPDLALRGS